MSSAVDNQPVETYINPAEPIFEVPAWRYRPPSVLAHHGRLCCSVAREWLLSTDCSSLAGQSKFTGPRWIRAKYKWGPSHWPMTWCDAIKQEELDCGALAALTIEVFRARGVNCYPVQLIQQYDANTTSHWIRKWKEDEAHSDWIGHAMIYHEACAVEIVPSEIKVWDPSAGWWANQKQAGGYGSIRSIRVCAANGADDQLLVWGSHNLKLNEWFTIPSTRREIGKQFRVPLSGCQRGDDALL